MKSKAIWMLYGVILAVVATVSVLSKAHAAETATAMLKPTKAMSFDVGAKRAVAYFRPVTGICNATVVLAPRLGETGDLPEAGARLTVPVLPGKKAVVDTAEGKGLEFGCAFGARSMTVRTVETVAWSNARS